MGGYLCYLASAIRQAEFANAAKDFGIKGKKTYGYQSAFCMETQNYPNACNVPSFKSTVLKKGEEYFSTTTYKFDY